MKKTLLFSFLIIASVALNAMEDPFGLNKTKKIDRSRDPNNNNAKEKYPCPFAKSLMEKEPKKESKQVGYHIVPGTKYNGDGACCHDYLVLCEKAQKAVVGTLWSFVAYMKGSSNRKKSE